MNSSPKHLVRRGFTLLETVIAIGVLAVLLTGFMIVFAPAAAGIKRAIGIQEADRLASTLEQELVTLRGATQRGSFSTGFAKAFKWIETSDTAANAVLIYQYRGSLTSTRTDETPEPVANADGKLPGKDYVVQTMVRLRSDPEFEKDLPAVEGGVYFVKCTQLVYNANQLRTGTAGKIVDPKNSGTPAASADVYPEAVIAFAADFHSLPAKSAGYFNSANGFTKAFTNAKNPVFTRNLAVRR